MTERQVCESVEGEEQVDMSMDEKKMPEKGIPDELALCGLLLGYAHRTDVFLVNS